MSGAHVGERGHRGLGARLLRVASSAFAATMTAMTITSNGTPWAPSISQAVSEMIAAGAHPCVSRPADS